jgi:putative transposase
MRNRGPWLPCAAAQGSHGPAFISAKLSEWCEQPGITLHWIQPGKPTQNACIERFNGPFRRELLDAHQFRSLARVRQLVDEWWHDYNTQRPHQALNFMTPFEFKQAAKKVFGNSVSQKKPSQIESRWSC